MSALPNHKPVYQAPPVPAEGLQAHPAQAAAEMTLGRWCSVNLIVGLSSFGGGNRLLLYRERVVSHGMSNERFDEIILYSQLLPGPNLVNAVAMIGLELQGLAGCVAGLMSLVLPATVIAMIAMLQLSTGGSIVSKMMHGAALSAAGLVMTEALAYAQRVLKGAGSSLRGGLFLVGAVAAAMVAASFAGAPLWALLIAGVLLSAWPKAAP